MALYGKILAIKEAAGYRPLMVVNTINYIPQKDSQRPSTVFYGNQLMFGFDNRPAWVTFMRLMEGRELTYSQLRMSTDYDTIDSEEMIWPKLPLVQVAEEKLTMIRGGHDPLAGYYVQFNGHARVIFAQCDWWHDTEIYSE